MKKRVLSGMQASGNPHLGNYLGAMKQHIEMQEEFECLYFIADYHALTTLRDPEKLRRFRMELAMDYLALGLDPKKTIFFRQSDVPEVTELTWILDTITPFGLLERAHAWKDALSKGKKESSVGLFNYPVLMACDILIYQSEIVPVGQDQKQHVEIARDIAGRFNHLYGETFLLPEPRIGKEVAVIPGTDGQKMSKSYGNTIDIFAPSGTLKEQVFRIVTDSKGVKEPKDPEICLPFLLFQFFASKEEEKEVGRRLLKGDMGYQELKNLLFERLLHYFMEAREKRIELEKDLSYVEGVLEEGQKRARKLAQKTLQDVREKIGLR